MSIVRVGLAETDGFAEGYDAIFGTKKQEKDEKPTAAKKKPSAKKKNAVKKAKKK